MGDYLTVASWVNNALSPNKGDADYTVALGDPNVVHFNTAFTAQRTITLPPQVSNDTCAALYFDLVFDGAINGANTAVIKQGTTTMRTQTVDKKVLHYKWRRSTWVLVGITTLVGVAGGTYTQIYSTAERTLSAYTPNLQNAAYTGTPVDAASTAKLGDLNSLRSAYENLRLFTEDLAQQHNSLIADLKAAGIIQ